MIRRIKKYLGIRLGVLIRNAEGEIDRRTLPGFANQPKNLHFQSPRRVSNPDCIWIGDDVSLGPGCLLSATKRYPGQFMQGGPSLEPQEFEPVIRIGDRVSATGFLTVGAVKRVEIDDDALLASHIFIADNQHGHGSVDIPFKYQRLDKIAPVRVGKGAWIGEHVVIMPGVEIGDMSIVGANSVVTASVPPYSIVAGSPARIVRQWDENDETWKRPGG